MSAPANVAASVMARLLTRAKANGDDYQLLVTAYALERLLYRIGQSPVRDRFVLKGAMLLRLWSEQPYRATRDLDLLRRGDASFDAIRADLEVIVKTTVPDDGITFDATKVALEPIRADNEYAGTRATIPARCGKARLMLQVDLGVGDAVWPEPKVRQYPALLDAPAPNVLAYERETVVAEKLEAIVVLGERNSRIKDFFDLHMLATMFAFDRRALGESVLRTFNRRQTPIPVDAPIGLTAAYWENPSRPTQVTAFARRSGIPATTEAGREFSHVLSAFLIPILTDVAAGKMRDGVWPPDGPWR
ncbi:MAG: nucleotidyl transferase AbiEii/AbiGii toxin family protein [Gemmatimonadaceae bacterium]|nr:nucleotidyl transferase AbiEii/AbiGii toxin family protein [Gemmatimonadaceae bacterium]